MHTHTATQKNETGICFEIDEKELSASSLLLNFSTVIAKFTGVGSVQFFVLLF
jgi:hypothetical protein